MVGQRRIFDVLVGKGIVVEKSGKKCRPEYTNVEWLLWNTRSHQMEFEINRNFALPGCSRIREPGLLTGEKMR